MIVFGLEVFNIMSLYTYISACLFLVHNALILDTRIHGWE